MICSKENNFQKAQKFTILQYIMCENQVGTNIYIIYYNIDIHYNTLYYIYIILICFIIHYIYYNIYIIYRNIHNSENSDTAIR